MVVGRAAEGHANDGRRKHFAELQLNVTGNDVKNTSEPHNFAYPKSAFAIVHDSECFM